MILLQKKKGSSGVLELLPVMLTIAICGIMVIFFANQARYMDVCNKVNHLARITILKMESSRGLTVQDQTDLVQELESLGVTDITLDGTTESCSGLRLGDEVTLCMSCVYRIPEMKLGGMMNVELPGVERHIQVKRSSVVLK